MTAVVQETQITPNSTTNLTFETEETEKNLFKIRAKYNDKTVGMIIFGTGEYIHFYGTGAYLVELLVHPDHRKRGIGGALLERMEKIAKEKDSYCVSLEANKVFDVIEFYTRRGYDFSLEEDIMVKTLK